VETDFLVDLLNPETTHHTAAEEWAAANEATPVGVPSFAAFEVLYGLADDGADETELREANDRLGFAVRLPLERADALAAAICTRSCGRLTRH